MVSKRQGVSNPHQCSAQGLLRARASQKPVGDEMRHQRFRSGLNLNAAGSVGAAPILHAQQIAIALEHPEDPSWYSGRPCRGRNSFDEYDSEACKRLRMTPKSPKPKAVENTVAQQRLRRARSAVRRGCRYGACCRGEIGIEEVSRTLKKKFMQYKSTVFAAIHETGCTAPD